MRAPRLLVGSLLAGLIAVSMSVGLAVPPAMAATVVNPVSPVTILPSVVKGAVSTGTVLGDNTLGVMYKFMMDPKTWEAWKISQESIANPSAPKPTPGQLTLIDDHKAGFRVPATKFGSLVKGAGAAGVAMTGYTVGAWLGNGTLDLLGMDATGTVCSNVGDDFIGSMVSAVSGADCAPFEAARDFIANSDAAMTLSGAQRCYLGECMQLIGSAVRSGGFTADARTYCFQGVINSGTMSASQLTIVFTNGTAASSRVNRANSGYSSACQAGTFQAGIDQSSATVTRTLLEYGWAGSSEPKAAVVQKPDNPARTFRCVTVGTNNVEYAGTSQSFTEKDTVLPRPKCSSPPAGIGIKATRILESPGVPGQPEHELYSQPTTPEYQMLQEQFPGCDSGTCILDLRSIGTGVASCLATPDACAGWFQDPQKADKWECTYNGTVVSLAECTVYAPAFEPEALVTGNPLGNPDNGQPMANPKPNTGKDVEVFGSGIQDPEKPRQCMLTGWGVFNPIEWVTKPVGCAIDRAFVPRPSVINAINGRIIGGFNNSTLGSAATLLGALEVGVPGVNGCGGIPWEFKVRTLEVDASLMNTCPGEPLHEVSGVVRGILVALLWTGAVLLWVRYLAGIVGYVPFGSAVNTNPGTSTAPPPIENIGTLTQVRPPLGGGGGQRAIGQ